MTKHTKGPWAISEMNAPAGYVSINGDGHEALALVVWQMDEDSFYLVGRDGFFSLVMGAGLYDTTRSSR